MGKADKIKFLAHYGLPEKTELSLTDMASLTGHPYEDLLTVFQSAKVYEYIPAAPFSFHKKPKETKAPTDKKAMSAVYKYLLKKYCGK